MPQELYDKQMEFLIWHVGDEVSCNYWELGEEKNVTGTLKKVIPYDKIVVGNNIVPFVSSSIALEQVSTPSAGIYYNGKARGYQGCYEYDFLALVHAQEEILGRSLKAEEIDARNGGNTPLKK